MKSAFELLKDGTARLENAKVPDAPYDARELLFSVLKTNADAFLLNRGAPVTREAEAAFAALLSRRIAGEPLQYLLGEWSFCGGTFSVGPGVLIPRPETQELVSLALEHTGAGRTQVWDLCAGSGCIGVSIAAARPQAQVVLFEKYAAAYRYLLKNIPFADAARIRPVLRDLMLGPPAGLPAPEILVANPPYIPDGEISALQPEVQREPVTALAGGRDGLLFYRAIAALWLPKLAPGGFLAVECGEEQAYRVAGMFYTFGETEICTDLYGAARFVCCKKNR